MAFNPLSVFHKNKRFWMAAILMVCMVTFVFCTGSRGGIDDLMGRWFGRKGTPLLKLNGSNYTGEDMDKLRSQRKLANDYMSRSAEFAFKKLTTAIMDISKKADGAKDQKRKEDTRHAAIDAHVARRSQEPTNVFLWRPEAR